ncbi:hypothetical protein FRC08_017382 [Ceratobasidium sp. 394]|nr:hypothetical protein FRC08_017382 [Ceratobasidium sp. 394]
MFWYPRRLAPLNLSTTIVPFQVRPFPSVSAYTEVFSARAGVDDIAPGGTSKKKCNGKRRSEPPAPLVHISSAGEMWSPNILLRFGIQRTVPVGLKYPDNSMEIS